MAMLYAARGVQLIVYPGLFIAPAAWQLWANAWAALHDGRRNPTAAGNHRSAAFQQALST